MPTAITSGTSTFLANASAFFFMADDETLVTTGNGIEVTAANVDLFVNGDIYSDSRGVFVPASFAGAEMTIGAAATIVATTIGIGIGGDDATLVNHGYIASLDAIGVNLEFGSAGGTSFANFGTVIGEEIGVQFDGTNQQVVNHGSISAQNGVLFSFGKAGTLVNHGDISGFSAADGAAYGVFAGFLSDDNTVVNFGTITGADAAIFVEASAGSFTVKNHGTLIGDVDLGNAGDTYRGGTDGVVVGQILTGEGDDTVRAGHHDDDIDGGADDDILNGRGGDEPVVGGVGDDVAVGGTGDDSLDGGDGANTMEGGRGDDRLVGGSQ